MLRAAFRRFLVVVAVIGTTTTVVSAGVGVIAGASLDRAVSLGFYLVGSFLLVMGFFVGNRGPVRLREKADANPLRGQRLVRPATAEERRETIGNSALFVVLGLVLVLVGIAVDGRFRLV